MRFVNPFAGEKTSLQAANDKVKPEAPAFANSVSVAIQSGVKTSEDPVLQKAYNNFQKDLTKKRWGIKVALKDAIGMELLPGLADDIGANFSIETRDGTHIKVIFDYKPVTAENVSFSQQH